MKSNQLPLKVDYSIHLPYLFFHFKNTGYVLGSLRQLSYNQCHCVKKGNPKSKCTHEESPLNHHEGGGAFLTGKWFPGNGLENARGGALTYESDVRVPPSTSDVGVFR